MKHRVELHFQEGFSGETVFISAGAKLLSSFRLWTRPQIGLARIEPLQLTPGQTVTVAIPELSLESGIQITGRERWITVNLSEGALILQAAQEQPGYL